MSGLRGIDNAINGGSRSAANGNSDGTCPVIVAARVRPLNETESSNYYGNTLTVQPNEASITVENRPGAFVFDHVYDTDSVQEDVYETAIKDLVENTFEGYNATVCAYGQTGSGKTHTMGTGVNYSSADVDNTRGIVPRAAEHFFAGIEERKRQALENKLQEPDFDISVQFIEIYNENFIDLFCSRDSRKKITVYYDKNVSSILVKNVTIRKIRNPAEMLEALKDGSVNRSVAATKMNNDSSRSHAIFTVYIRQKRQIPSESADSPTDFKLLNAKFHFVDLAGSERMDKTGATGAHALEGININSGLLQLGNVVNALVSGAKFVPYRNSKLTLMLQDSLGGNSRTAVIVCVSPSTYNYAETLQTLNFGLRLRNITTKVTANQDPQSAIINELREKVKRLQTENDELKNGKRTVDGDGEVIQSDLYRENLELMEHIKQHVTRIKALESVIESLNSRNASLQRDAILKGTTDGNDGTDGDTVSSVAIQMVENIEKLHSQIHEYQATIDDLNKQVNHYRRILIDINQNQGSSLTTPIDDGDSDFLSVAMQNVELFKAKAAHIRNIHKTPNKKPSSDEDGETDEEGDEPMDTADDGDDVAMESDTVDDEEEGDNDDAEIENSKNVARTIADNLVNIDENLLKQEKLIDQELMYRAKILTIRNSYEEKVKNLKETIKTTAEERDRQIAELQKAQMRSGGNHADNKVQIEKVKKEYEKKMAVLLTEQTRFKAIEKSQKILQLTIAQKDKAIEMSQKEMRDLKANKVDLVKELKAVQASRTKFQQAAAKQARQQSIENQKCKNKIQLLERKNNMHSKILAQTRAEMKKKTKDFEMNQKLKAIANGPVARSPKKSAAFNPDRVRKLLKNLTAGVISTARHRQLYDLYNDELASILQDRKKLEHRRAELVAEFMNTMTIETTHRLDSEMESINERTAYIETRQMHLQKLIVGEVDESAALPGVPNESEMEKLIQSCRGSEEYKYVLSKFISFAIDRICNMSKTEHDLKNKVQTLTQSVEDMKEMRMMALADEELIDFFELSQPIISQSENVNPISKPKFRRRTSTPNDLLYGGSLVEPLKVSSASNLIPVPEESIDLREALQDVNVGAIIPSEQQKRQPLGDCDTSSTLSNVIQPALPSMDQSNTTAVKNDSFFRMKGHTRTGVNCLSTVGNVLVSGGRDHNIFAWDLHTHKSFWKVFNAHAYSVNEIALSADERILASAAGFSTRIYDVRSNQACLKIVNSSGIVEEPYPEVKFKRQDIPKSETCIDSLCWDPDGNVLYSGTRNCIRMFDIRFLNDIGSFNTPTNGRIKTLKVRPHRDADNIRILVNHRMTDNCESGCLYSYVGKSGSADIVPTIVPIQFGPTNFAVGDKHVFTTSNDGKMSRYTLVNFEREAQVWSADGSNFKLIEAGKIRGDPMVFAATETGVVSAWNCSQQQSMILQNTYELKTPDMRALAFNNTHGTLYAGTGLMEIVKII